MLLSKSCVYGLRASLFLASEQKGKYVSIREMSDKLDISFHFLTKILQQLTSAGLLESMKGPKGGVRLTQPADKITLFDIVISIDGRELFTECVLGLPGCGIEKPCPLHEQWADKRENIREMLQESTLGEMVSKGRKGDLRITAEGTFEWV